MPQVKKSESTRHRLWEFVKRQIVDDVPEDLKICEVYCRKEQCMQDEWDTCERRIRRGAGELFPLPRHGRSEAALSRQCIDLPWFSSGAVGHPSITS
jgi:hypothetical protein